MRFKFDFSVGKTKKESPETIEHITPQQHGSEYFYPINMFEDQSDRALISMYNEVADVSIPINYILDNCSRVPLKHYIQKTDGTLQHKENSKVEEVLDKPNQYEEYEDFVKTYLLDEILLGNIYLNRIRPIGYNRITQLYIIPAEQCKPKLENKDEKDFRKNSVIAYKWTVEGSEMSLKSEDIIHRKNASKNKKSYYIGNSRLIPALIVSKSLRYNYQARAKLYKDGGALGMITPKFEGVTLGSIEAEMVENKLKTKYGLTGNQNPNIITPVPLDYKKMGIDAKQLDLNANKVQDFQTICSVLNVHSILVNDNSRATYNNVKEATANFWINNATPKMLNMASTLGTAFNLPKNEKILPDFSSVEALQDDLKLKNEIYNVMFVAGAITLNEYRKQMKFDKIDRNEFDDIKPKANTNE